MKNKKNILLLALCLTISLINSKTSIATKEELRKVKKISSSLQTETSKTDILLAEWTYINRSDRLEKLAEKHLDLITIKPEQIVLFSNKTINMALNETNLDRQVASAKPRKKPRKS